MHSILHWYIIVSLCVTGIVLIAMAWEDFDMRFIHKYRRATSKFGYNCRSKFSAIILAATLPFVNILTVIFFVFTMVSNIERDKKQPKQ